MSSPFPKQDRKNRIRSVSIDGGAFARGVDDAMTLRPLAVAVRQSIASLKAVISRLSRGKR